MLHLHFYTIYLMLNYSLPDTWNYKAKEYTRKLNKDKSFCTLFCMRGIHLPQMILGWFDFEHLAIGLWIQYLNNYGTAPT